tara:strand:- start:662 stop:1333 length:672 start_codon:yes stop_codon:yes gene_type:complete
MALTKFNFNSFDVTTAASKGLGFNASANGFSTFDDTSMVLIKTITASSDSTISFVDGSSDVVFDNTYPVYLFKFIACHPSGSGDSAAVFQFNMSVDTGSNYNVTKTSYAFEARNSEGGGSTALTYNTGRDLSQSTDFQVLTDRFDSLGDDYNVSGELYIFNPSSTTFVKHYIARTNFINSNINYFYHIGGYGNTTSAVDAIQFKFSPSNIDAGTIKLYGIKDS